MDSPALAPPFGQIPQLHDPPNSRESSLQVMVSCLSIATLALGMRMYTKLCIVSKVTSADYFLIIAWCFFVGYFVPSWLALKIAAKVHQWDVRLEQLSWFLKYVHFASILYGVCIFFVKTSILVQLLEIFSPARVPDLMWWSCWILLMSNTLFYFITTMASIFACSPMAKIWDPSITTGHCISQYGLDLSAAAINTFSDLVMTLLPQLGIWRLRMPWRRKIGSSIIFLLGIFATMSSAVRMVYSVKVYESPDKTWFTWFEGVWTFAEMMSGFLVACLPVFVRFYQSISESKAALALRSLLHVRIDSLTVFVTAISEKLGVTGQVDELVASQLQTCCTQNQTADKNTRRSSKPHQGNQDRFHWNSGGRSLQSLRVDAEDDEQVVCLNEVIV